MPAENSNKEGKIAITSEKERERGGMIARRENVPRVPRGVRAGEGVNRLTGCRERLQGVVISERRATIITRR